MNLQYSPPNSNQIFKWFKLFQTLGGDGSNFTMNPQNGEFSVTKKLDYEAGQFYLFNMIVTV